MKVRFGIIGSNFIVDWFRQAAALCSDCEITAVYSRTEERAQKLAREWGVPHAHHSLESLAADDTVDAVYIASPNVCHAEQAIRMLKAGKHVLCEKPMAISAEQLAQMEAAAESSGVVLLEAMRSAHGPVVPALRSAMEQIGPIRTASFSYCQYSSRYDKWKKGIVENAFDPAMGGGALTDLGVYCVNMLVMLLGQPGSVRAHASFLPGSIDAMGDIVARYPGFSAALTYSKIHDSSCPCEVAGENGVIQFGPVGAPRWARWKKRGEEWKTIGLAICEQDMYYEIEDFIAMVRGELDPSPWRQWSGMAAKLLDEARSQAGIDYRPHAPRPEETRDFV